MPIIHGQLENPTKLKVLVVNYLQTDASNGGYFVQSVPSYPEPIRGKSQVMYFNPEISEFWFEQEDRPLTQDEDVEDLKELLADLASLVLGVGANG